MSDPTPKHMNPLLAGASAMAIFFAGIAVAPAILSADAKEIVAAPVAPPAGAPMSFANLIQRVSPAVVSIEVKSAGKNENALDPDDMQNLPPGFEEFLRRMNPNGQPQQPQRPREATALGSGFFISDKGVIVTNHHVVEDATSIKIKTSDGKSYTAELVGSDEATDLAVLRVVKPDQTFSFVKFDTDSDLRVGDWVVAVGNPFGLEGTATAGIVSAKGRRGGEVGNSLYTDFVQIDAPINRGNSGGPTFDLQGRVVGVNSAIYSPTGGSVGIGFAIPSETASVIVDQIISGGKVTRGWIGVSVQQIDDDMARSLGLANTKGAMVANLVPGGPAEKAGLRQGDVILKVDGKEIEDQRDLTRRVGGLGVGKTAQLDVLRDGARRNVALKLGERPGEQQLASMDGRAPNRGADGAAPDAGVVKQASLGADFRPATQADRQKFNLAANSGGMVVSRLDEDGPLAKKGLREGDVILSAGGQPIRTGADLTAALATASKAKRPVLIQFAGSAGRGYVAVEPKAS